MIRLGAVPIARLSGRRMSAGRMSEPNVSAASREVIQKAADALLDELDYQVEAVGVEAEYLTPENLAVNSDGYYHVFQDYDWDIQEVRTQVALDAAALENVADRMTRGSLMPYMTQGEIARAESAFSKAQNIWQRMRSLDMEPIEARHQQASIEHLATHMDALDHGISDLERAVVSAEAGTVPVIEPYERNSTIKTIAIVGGVIAVLIAIGLSV